MVRISEIKEMIEGNPLALATCDKDGKPHTIVVADVKVISKDEIIIGDNYMRNTIKNIKENNNISLAVWDNSRGNEAKGYRLNGIATYFSSGKWLDKARQIHENSAKGAIIVKINEISKLLG